MLVSDRNAADILFCIVHRYFVKSTCIIISYLKNSCYQYRQSEQVVLMVCGSEQRWLPGQAVMPCRTRPHFLLTGHAQLVCCKDWAAYSSMLTLCCDLSACWRSDLELENATTLSRLESALILMQTWTVRKCINRCSLKHNIYDLL